MKSIGDLNIVKETHFACYVEHCAMDNIVLGKDIAIVMMKEQYNFMFLFVLMLFFFLGFYLGWTIFRLKYLEETKKEYQQYKNITK